jgi:hypothetical protein
MGSSIAQTMTVDRLVAIGVLYRRRTAPVATTRLAIDVALGLTIAAVKTATSGV